MSVFAAVPCSLLDKTLHCLTWMFQKPPAFGRHAVPITMIHSDDVRFTLNMKYAGNDKTPNWNSYGSFYCMPDYRNCLTISVLLSFFIMSIQTREEMHVHLNTESRSRNHCCRRKAIRTTCFSVCECVRGRARAGEGVVCGCGCTNVGACLRGCSLTYPASEHEPYCLRLLWLNYIFRHYLINDTFYGRKLLNIKCVFQFSLQLLFETFLILRIIQRRSHKCKNVFM